MKTCYPLHGIVPTINTPFDDQLQIDFPSLERLLEKSISEGVVGCLVPVVASEVYKLSLSERKKLVETVYSVVDRRLKVIAGVSSERLDEAKEMAKHAVKVGCAGVLCRVPVGLQDNDEGIFQFFSDLATAGMDMLMIQDLAWSSYGMKLELILRLFESIPAFRCIKIETVPSGLKSTQVLEATEGRLNVSNGWSMPQMIEALDRGVHAINSTAINKPFVRIYQLHHRGRRADAIALFEKVVPYLAWATQHIDISIHFLKRYCKRRELFSTINVRQPSLPYDRYHEKCGEELIEKIIVLENELA